jgi:hypothetical protein
VFILEEDGKDIILGDGIVLLETESIGALLEHTG